MIVMAKKNRNTGCENFVRCGCGDYLNDDAIRNENVSTMRTTPKIWLCFSTGKKGKGFENRYSSPIRFGSPLLGDASSPSSPGLSIASTAFSFLIRGVLRSVPPDKCLYAISISFFPPRITWRCAPLTPKTKQPYLILINPRLVCAQLLFNWWS